MPRALLRFFAQNRSVALTKTMLAYILRGLAIAPRTGEINAKGTVKASWISVVLNLSERAVKYAQAWLREHGWIAPDTHSHQCKLNRHCLLQNQPGLAFRSAAIPIITGAGSASVATVPTVMKPNKPAADIAPLARSSIALNERARHGFGCYSRCMSPERESLTPSTQGAAQFATTHWSVVLAAGRDSSANAFEALEQLCRVYWYPLYAYVRRRGYGPEDAQDLTQSFFTRLLEKNYVHQADRGRGKFRTFLLSALNHFLADEWDRAQRLKRGGAQTFVSFDAATAEERYRLEPAHRLDAAKLFERRWATTLLESAMNRLEREFRERDQAKLFDGLRTFLVGDCPDGTYSETAPALGLTSGAMKMAVSRMRARCRDLLREEIAQTVTSPHEAEEEYRSLVAALRS